MIDTILKRYKETYNEDFQAVALLEPFYAQIQYMEETKGEPMILKYQDSYLLVDGSKETPDRRSVCYDKDSRINRKKFPPITSALEECEKHQVFLMTQDIYHHLQLIKPVDLKTSSWILTPEPIRSLGGALFSDRRYNQVFTYHNGADSYYGVRGFRVFVELGKQ